VQLPKYRNIETISVLKKVNKIDAKGKHFASIQKEHFKTALQFNLPGVRCGILAHLQLSPRNLAR
jgi:hypothetical protein